MAVNILTQYIFVGVCKAKGGAKYLHVCNSTLMHLFCYTLSTYYIIDYGVIMG